MVDTVCVPMDVDAFVLNRPVCDSGEARIAPITQPDYLGLRPDKTQIRADILPHVDVTSAQPASINSRISAVESLQSTPLDPNSPLSDIAAVPPLRENRIGVYVHWSLPRLYRVATSGASDVQYASDGLVREHSLNTSPQFRLVPNRWCVVRNIRSSIPEAPAAEKRRAWVVESDMLFDISDLPPEVDLQTDVSPYVTDGHSSPDSINAQSSVYIGAKFAAAGWPQNRPRDPKRIALTVMNSSNFCFADNAVHNPNVFSIIDNFGYQDAAGNNQYLKQVTCDYSIVGWHDDEFEDPLNPKNGIKGAMRDRLHALFLEPSAYFESQPTSLNSHQEARTLCHGTVYNVQFDRNLKPDKTPADQFARLFKLSSNIPMEPISVGTTGLDSILSFLRAHEARTNNDNRDVPFGPGTRSVAEDLLSLARLLEATGGDYDSHIKAADLIDARNFTPSEGGREWQFDGKAAAGAAPARPGSSVIPGFGISEREFLRRVSDLQYRLDTAKRNLKLKRWSLFAVWWSFVSDVQNEDPARIAFYKALLEKYRSEVLALIALISAPNTGLEGRIALVVKSQILAGAPMPPLVPARSVPQPTFFKRRDPTICLAGMDSGWLPEYAGYVLVRLKEEILTGTPGDPTSPLPFAPNILPLANVLFREALNSTENGQTLRFKRWQGQPWHPLYIEWEADYFHIPIDKWSVSLISSATDITQRIVRYGIKDALFNDSSNASDRRAVSGRAILLPHSGINLKALVEQVLTDPSVTLSDTEINDLKANVNKLKFSVAEMEGLTTNLLTLGQGTHIQPNFSQPGVEGSTPIPAALAAGAPIGFTQSDFTLIGEETALTPYGGLLDFSGASKRPFKGVTHGQFRFSKLNIIDKFGQVISAIPPKMPLKDPNAIKETIFPCLGDQVCPGFVRGTNQLNTITPITEVDQDLLGDYPLCPYVQLTPAINQEARLNASFLIPQFDRLRRFREWRRAADWEQPVFAWVVVNVADQALQFFTGAGVFFVEMTLGGPANSIKSPSWQPFDPPSNPLNTISPQLQSLISAMTHPTTGAAYLRSFWEMIAEALASMSFAPASYGAYATSIIGKPFALVNVGFSLELALPPLESQVIPPLQPSIPNEPSDAEKLFGYKFPFKIGDKDRPFDGVVGYCDADGVTAGVSNWAKLFTYFMEPGGGTTEQYDPRVEIVPENFDTLSPYYIDPEGSFGDNGFVTAHTAKMKAKTLLIDPYTSLHVYSPILPIKSLKLPDWTVQSAFERMSAFFHVGPIMITQNIPTVYDESKEVAAKDWIHRQQNSDVPRDAAPIRLPLRARKGTWNWLQPFPLQEESDGRRHYNSFEVGEGKFPLSLFLVQGWH
ncbi:hypothetical protein BCR34DRAFT_137208 [Clohesyomyces aquaticus]|uniref:Uncharacterized protein n=1 Tax=Clohesyomyces aquaticus TaxID=1231657 RepID=A0A1Y2A0X3_9PLEO|nr:hypothetical protein BCR34DRAFT_137208 [Clohesyomyces aquaticus]